MRNRERYGLGNPEFNLGGELDRHWAAMKFCRFELILTDGLQCLLIQRLGRFTILLVIEIVPARSKDINVAYPTLGFDYEPERDRTTSYLAS